MRSMMTRVLLVLALVVGALGCGGDEEAQPEPSDREIELLDAPFIPARILDLEVDAEEAPPDLASAPRSYLDALRLYSLRQDDILHATLQVSRFSDDANYSDPSFRRTLLGRLGTSNPLVARVGGHTVYLTSGVKQGLAIWFTDDYMFILGTRQEYERPRELLREVLEIEVS